MANIRLVPVSVLNSDIPASTGPLDNFLHTIYDAPYEDNIPFDTGFIHTLDNVDQFFGGQPNTGSNITPKEMAASMLMSDMGSFDRDISNMLQYISTFTGDNIDEMVQSVDDGGNLTLSLSSNNITLSLTYNPAISIYGTPTADVSFNRQDGKRKIMRFAVLTKQVNSQSLAATVVLFLYINLRSVAIQTSASLAQEPGFSYTYNDIYNDDGTLNWGGKFARNVTTGLEKALTHFGSSMITDLIKIGVKLLLMQDIEMDYIGLVACYGEIIGTVIYYELILPLISKKIMLDLYICNYTDLDINVAIPYQYNLSIIKSYMQAAAQPLYPNFKNQAGIIPAGTGGDTRINYGSYIFGNSDTADGLGFTMQLMWSDANDTTTTTPSEHSLALGIDIPLDAPGGNRIRLDWKTADYDWYDDDVEGGNDQVCYWPTSSTFTAVRAVLTMQPVKGLDNAYISVLYLWDGRVPAPTDTALIMQGIDPSVNLPSSFDLLP